MSESFLCAEEESFCLLKEYRSCDSAGERRDVGDMSRLSFWLEILTVGEA